MNDTKKQFTAKTISEDEHKALRITKLKQDTTSENARV